ncbi:MAG: hypothetical protein R3C56_02185 [Pirellulaceae bacterium]
MVCLIGYSMGGTYTNSLYGLSSLFLVGSLYCGIGAGFLALGLTERRRLSSLPSCRGRHLLPGCCSERPPEGHTLCKTIVGLLANHLALRRAMATKRRALLYGARPSPSAQQNIAR